LSPAIYNDIYTVHTYYFLHPKSFLLSFLLSNPYLGIWSLSLRHRRHPPRYSVAFDFTILDRDRFRPRSLWISSRIQRRAVQGVNIGLSLRSWSRSKRGSVVLFSMEGIVAHTVKSCRTLIGYIYHTIEFHLHLSPFFSCVLLHRDVVGCLILHMTSVPPPQATRLSLTRQESFSLHRHVFLIEHCSQNAYITLRQ